MTHDLVSLEIDETGVATISLNDEIGKNALSKEIVDELSSRLQEVGQEASAKVCILQGLPNVFCPGGSKDMLLQLAAGTVAATDIMLSRAVLEVPIPTIAAMAGHAVGGGLTLGLCCDVILLGRSSRYGCSFMNMGFTPGMGTTRLLSLAFGEFIAAEMMYGGEFFRGRHFEGRSAVNYVLPGDQVNEKASAIAARMAEKPRASLELLKRSLSIKKRQLFEEARSVETFMHELSFSHPETAQLIREFYEGED